MGEELANRVKDIEDGKVKTIPWEEVKITAEIKKPLGSSREEWTPAGLVSAVKAGSMAEKVALLKTIGILTPEGQLADKYKNWGDKPSRTPGAEDEGAAPKLEKKLKGGKKPKDGKKSKKKKSDSS